MPVKMWAWVNEMTLGLTACSTECLVIGVVQCGLC